MGGVAKKEGRWELYKKTPDLPWYYWVYDENLKRRTFSTGCMRKADAKELVLEREKNGTLIPEMDTRHKKSRNMCLSDYGRDFWNYNTCPIIKGKIARGGHFSPKVAKANAQKFKDHVEPYFGEYQLTKIKPDMIENWLLSLPEDKGISNKTANDSFFAFRQMLEQAVFEGHIRTNPAKGIKPLVKKTIRSGAFTVEQIKALFAEPWQDKWAYTACFLASRTGMRIGEVKALTLAQVHPNYIEVNASWSSEEGRKSTKSGWDRNVPINEQVYKTLMEIAPKFPSSLFFTLNGKTPVCDSYFSNRLKAKMDEINEKKMGEDKENKTLFFDYSNPNAPLTFHSFRHFLNTRLLAADIPTSKIQAIIGHESDKMTEHYAHLDASDLQAVKEIQFSLA